MPTYEALGAWAGRLGTWKEGDPVEMSAEKAEPFLDAGLLELLDEDDDEFDLDEDEPIGEPSGATARHVKTSRKRSGSKTVRKPAKERL